MGFFGEYFFLFGNIIVVTIASTYVDSIVIFLGILKIVEMIIIIERVIFLLVWEFLKWVSIVYVFVVILGGSWFGIS